MENLNKLQTELVHIRPFKLAKVREINPMFLSISESQFKNKLFIKWSTNSTYFCDRQNIKCITWRSNIKNPSKYSHALLSRTIAFYLFKYVDLPYLFASLTPVKMFIANFVKIRFNNFTFYFKICFASTTSNLCSP